MAKINSKNRCKTIFGLVAILLFSLSLVPASFAVKENKVIIYQNEACGHCLPYLLELNNFLIDAGFKIEDKEVINNVENRKELIAFIEKNQIPRELQGHMMIVINDNLILQGHVPIKLLEEYLLKYPTFDFPYTIIYQDSMEIESAKTYRVMNEKKEVADCDITQTIAECQQNSKKQEFVSKSLFLFVLINGLLAGIHPCTISVLLFFIAFLFTIRKSKSKIFAVGAAFITGVFIAYFFIGLGLFKAVVFSTSPHLAAKIGALLITALGLFNLLSYFMHDKVKLSLGLPKFIKPKIIELIHNASVPAALIVGILVGICSFGCTAGIYISILGLLLTKATYAKGFAYLLMYNILFILPLIAILLASSNKAVIERMERLEASEKRWIKLIAGIVMLIMAAIIAYIAW
ncbi:hypothetical protein J4206_04205 [Candidatus Woesearchaeota archaeon]|nr:hypothetical protein [Candidatus Woesearchaeota archaeon]